MRELFREQAEREENQGGEMKKRKMDRRFKICGIIVNYNDNIFFLNFLF